MRPEERFYRDFIAHVTTNLIFPQDEYKCGLTLDWWTIEVAKYILNGERTYLQELPPKRLRRVQFDPNIIIEDGEKKLATLELLKELKNKGDHIIAYNIGRGINLALAYYVRLDWKSVKAFEPEEHKENRALATKFFVTKQKKLLEFVDIPHTDKEDLIITEEDGSPKFIISEGRLTWPK